MPLGVARFCKPSSVVEGQNFGNNPIWEAKALEGRIVMARKKQNGKTSFIMRVVVFRENKIRPMKCEGDEVPAGR